MSEYISNPKSLGANVNLHLSNNTAKTDLKKSTEVDTSDFSRKIDLVNIKSDVDKLDVDNLKNVPTNLTNLKSKVGKLDVGKLVPALADLSKLSNVVKNNVFQKAEYNELVKKVNNIKTTDTSDSVKKITRTQK